MAQGTNARSTQALSGAAVTGLVLKLEGGDEVANPPEVELFAAIEALTAFGGPGFLVLEREDGSYAQTAGGEGSYTVEWRDILRDGFRHYVAGKGAPRDRFVSIPTNGFQVTVQENERLAIGDVKRILGAFKRGEARPNAFSWRDISEALDDHGVPALEVSGDTCDEALEQLSAEDSLWGDPPDVKYTEEEEFEILRECGIRPEQFADKEEGQRYREWLAKNPASEG